MSGLHPLNTNSDLPPLDVIPQMFPDIARCPGQATSPLVANRSHILSSRYGTCTLHSLIYLISKITPGGRGNYFHFTHEETEKVSCLLTAPGLRTQPWVCSFSASLCRRQGWRTLRAWVLAAETSLRAACSSSGLPEASAVSLELNSLLFHPAAICRAQGLTPSRPSRAATAGRNMLRATELIISFLIATLKR